MKNKLHIQFCAVCKKAVSFSFIDSDFIPLKNSPAVYHYACALSLCNLLDELDLPLETRQELKAITKKEFYQQTIHTDRRVTFEDGQTNSIRNRFIANFHSIFNKFP